MARYRYLFADALTGQLIEELPLDCQSYSQQVNGVGTCTGTLAIADPTMPSLWRQATIPKRSLLMAQRDDNATNPAWGGIITKRRPVKDSTSAEISAETLEGYWQRRKIKTDLTQTGADLFDIVRAIITQLQAVTGGNLRMLVGSGLHGSTTTITYAGKDRTRALDAINRLAEVSSFEYTITWSRTNNIFTPTLVLAAPGLGVALDAVTLEFPGSLGAPVEDPEDGADAPNALTGIGADNAGTPLLSEAVDTTGEIAAGYPLYEDEWQAKDEADQARLDTRTAAQLAARLTDRMIPTVELTPPTGDPGDITLGDLTLGQPTRLRCTCSYHPPGTGGRPGLDTTARRITGWTVAPKAVEKVTLALSSATGLIRPPRLDRGLDDRIADLDRRVRQLATRT